MASENMRRSIEHHAPSEKNVREIVKLRRAALVFADALENARNSTPIPVNLREFSLAETKFEECVMWAVKGLVLPPE